MMKRVVHFAMLAMALAVPALPAAAQGLPQGQYERGTPVDAVPTPFSNGGSCIKACRQDYSPCDPDYFKVADRRCNVNKNGYF